MNLKLACFCSFFLMSLCSSYSFAREKVVFWRYSAVESEKIIDEALVEMFEKKHPTIKVVVKNVSAFNENDITSMSKLISSLSSGKGPDVYKMDRFLVAENAASGLLEDLTQRAEKDNLADKHLRFAWDELIYQGKVYGLPINTDVRLLFYRKDLLKKTGFDLDKIDREKVSGINLDWFLRETELLDKKNKEGNYERAAFIPYYGQGWHYTWGFAFHGKFSDITTGKVTPLDEGVLKAFYFLRDMGKKYSPGKLQSIKRVPMTLEEHPFVQGKTLFSLNGSWFMGMLDNYEKKFEYGMTWIPTPDAKRVSWSGGWSFVVPKGASNVSGAWTFIKFMVSEEAQEYRWVKSKQIPTLKSLLNNGLFKTDRMKFIAELLKYSKSRPPLPTGAYYWKMLTKTQKHLLHRGGEPKTLLKDVEERVNSRLARFSYKGD